MRLRAAVGGAAALGVAAHRVRLDAALRKVRPDLRGPHLLISGTMVTPRTLWLMRLMNRMPMPAPKGCSFEDTWADDGSGARVRVLIYRPKEPVESAPAVLWFHGGGYIFGVPEQNHPWCARMASTLGVTVVSVNYRLAPEHPFPAALNDGLLALRWMRANAESLGIDPTRIAVAGESAGGGLAATVVQAAVDEGIPLAFQALIYPMLDDRSIHAADHDGRGRFLWTAGCNRFGWSSYLGQPAGESSVPAGSVPARRESLVGLPPAWIGVGTLDLFLTEDQTYAERLRADGVPCEFHLEEGAYHGADVVKAGAPSSIAFRNRVMAALRDGLKIT